MNCCGSNSTRVRPYDTIDINEMALVVYNATVNPEQRKAAEKMFGSQLKEKWYKLNEYCMDLKKYFHVAKSTRRDVITTLDQIYAHDIPIELDFADTSADSETQSMTPLQATEACEEASAIHDSGIYDSDWLQWYFQDISDSYSVCDDYLNSNPTSRDVFNASSLSDCIMSILESGGAEQNQEDLLNLLGVEAVEFVFTIMEHRDALLHTPDDNADLLKDAGVSSLSNMHQQHSEELSSKPIDDLGLNATYLAQLKQQGLRLPNEPKGYDDRYKGYLIGMKLDHSVTTDEKCGGRKTYHEVSELMMTDDQGYEELLVQPQQQQKSQVIELVPVSKLEDWAQMVFEGVEKFNRLQSWVFDCAYNTDNNMLVCAPTGM